MYQEQVIQITQKVANFSAADIFRKVMSKKEGKKMQSIKDRFIESAIKDFFNSHQLTQFIDQQNPLCNFYLFLYK